MNTQRKINFFQSNFLSLFESLNLGVVFVLNAWLALLSHLWQVPLHWSHYAILTLSCWLAYTGDHLIDVFKTQPLTLRHHFTQKYKFAFLALFGVFLGFDLLLAFEFLPLSTLLYGLLLTSACFLYALANKRSGFPSFFPKELQASLILTLGIAFFLLNSELEISPYMLLPLSLIASLFFSNLALISIWEKNLDQQRNEPSLALRIPSLKKRLLVAFVCLFLLNILLLDQPSFLLVCATSFTFLIALDVFRSNINLLLRRILADLALILPALAHFILNGT